MRYLVRECTTLYLHHMIHMRPPLDQDLHLGRIWALMSSNPEVASATVIYSAHALPSVLARSELNDMATSILAPWGHLLMAATTSYMAEVLLGEI